MESLTRILCPLPLLLAAAAAWGAGDARPVSETVPKGAMKASSLIGMPVVNRDSGATGRIDELVVDIANNRVHYAVLDMENRRLVQPLERLEIRRGGERAVMPQAPKPGPVAPRAGMALARASTLLGWEIENRAGEDLGRIVELLVEPQSGRIAFAQVQLRNAPAGELRPMPLDGFAMYPMRENLVLEGGSARSSAGDTATAARTKPAGGTAMFRRMDRDHDGFLSDRDLDRPIAERRNWLAIDLDGDGRISLEEFTAMRQQ